VVILRQRRPTLRANQLRIRGAPGAKFTCPAFTTDWPDHRSESGHARSSPGLEHAWPKEPRQTHRPKLTHCCVDGTGDDGRLHPADRCRKTDRRCDLRRPRSSGIEAQSSLVFAGASHNRNRRQRGGIPGPRARPARAAPGLTSRGVFRRHTGPTCRTRCLQESIAAAGVRQALPPRCADLFRTPTETGARLAPPDESCRKQHGPERVDAVVSRRDQEKALIALTWPATHLDADARKRRLEPACWI